MDKIEIKRLVAEAGAVGVGVVTLGTVDDCAEELYQQWIAQGKHGEMAYLEKYADVRHDPRLLLDGAKSMIVAAFCYNCGVNGLADRKDALKWARYALGRDYHEEVRDRLGRVAEVISQQTGAACRVTVDTAPLRERYWAVKAGVGFLGVNNQLIVPGAGSWCVLGEIITTLDIEADAPCEDSCLGCMRCVQACPGHALDGCGGMDARKCKSYLSIEYRGDDVTPLGDRIYGCDICQEVCPHNVGVTLSNIGNFKPRETILALSREDISVMEQSEFSRIFSHSAIKRTKLAGLQRNARAKGTEGATPQE